MVKSLRPLRSLQGERGITYLVVLLLVVLMGVGLGVAGTLWHTAQMREKEKELLFAGHAYRAAIQSYYASTPGPVKHYPRELSDLLKDPRQLQIVRHLRKLYRDPITGDRDWRVVRAADGVIAAVYSSSGEAPFKTANFDKADAAFEGKQHYSDWKFGSADAVGTDGPIPATNGSR